MPGPFSVIREESESTMHTDTGNRPDALHDIVEQKITALVKEMVEADWSAGDVASAIRDVVEARWLSQEQALQAARNATPDDFVSDGNEG